MQNKKFKKIVVAITIFSMMAIYGSVPGVKAASLSTVSDTLSTSQPAVAATHTVNFGTTATVPASGTIEVTLDNDFGDITSAICPTGSTLSTTTMETVVCTLGGQLTASTSIDVIIVAANSAAGSQTVTVTTKNDSAVVLESSSILVAIVDAVTMSATVAATLTFTVAGTSTGAVINGITTTSTSTATTTPFGTIASGANYAVGQDLTVLTNADGGYIVTVQQNGEMSNAGGSNINSFNNSADGTGTTTPEAWANPLGILDQDWTYGHMGLTTNDDNAYGVDDFSGSQLAGLSGASPMTIMAHNGPADGATGQKGLTSVAYQVRVSPLQEAGDYSNTLTYICTPTY